jgi:hypothetical protein
MLVSALKFNLNSVRISVSLKREWERKRETKSEMEKKESRDYLKNRIFSFRFK